MARVEIVRHNTNPFIQNRILNFREQKRRIKIGTYKKNNEVLGTGEIAHIDEVKYIERVVSVDNEQFVKIYANNMSETLDFSSAGQKAFKFLLWQVQNYAQDKDVISITDYDYDEYIKKNSKKDRGFGKATFWRGIRELEKKEVICKHRLLGQYFINPHYLFNGDRTALINVDIFINEDTEQGKQIAEQIEKENEPNLFNQPHLQHKE